MTHFVVAYIPPQDHDAFRRILHGHISGTHDEWLQFHAQKLAQMHRRGDTYREVQIHADEFADAVNAHRVEPTLDGLDRFAELKAASDPKKGSESV